MNFPQKTFFSKRNMQYYTFYRQGHCVTQPADQEQENWVERITNADLGNMFLLFEQALVVRSSNFVLFFKKNYNDP
jgi:hypothetical protein